MSERQELKDQLVREFEAIIAQMLAEFPTADLVTFS